MHGDDQKRERVSAREPAATARERQSRIPALLCLATVGAALLLIIYVFSNRRTMDRPDFVTATAPDSKQPETITWEYVGSAGCRDCHADFYELWAPSFHGLAMQPYTPEFARAHLDPQPEALTIGEYRYRAEIEDDPGRVIEHGPQGEQNYTIVHVLGGKYIYYFLALLERGRLQTLPVAFDVRRREWIDTAGSAVRHFPDGVDEALPWTHTQFTFNTSCFSCHVSQLSTNYDPDTDTYHTIWAEPGINCETCHGPAGEHDRVFREAEAAGLPPPTDLKIISTRDFTVEQTNDLCAICHAKAGPITTAFMPGDRFFDHADLVTLEHPDFYPDGRDLGENYTFTLWRMSPCVQSGQLDCMHCHTSSGRYRFHGERANEACLPCHAERVATVEEHSRHPANTEGGRCISCHMPMTEFARMSRSDHSMLPPTPAATIAYQSPNACNLCHADQTPQWADEHVRSWHERDYQKPMLQRAGLIDAARKADWTALPEMLAAITAPDREEIYANSLIRLLRPCEDERKWPALLAAAKDSSPLIRATTAEALGDRLDPGNLAALIELAGDDYRLVRIRAAAALAPVDPRMLVGEARARLSRAVEELKESMQARPDDAAAHYNLGNFFMQRQDYPRAIEAFETSIRLRPDLFAPLVNASIVYSLLGRNDRAEQCLRQALEIEPYNAAALFNLGLLLAEQKRWSEAETALRGALKAEPETPAAAYNLAVILSGDRIDEAIEWCRKAAQLRPAEPKYAYTLAFYLRQKGDINAAFQTLRKVIEAHPDHTDSFQLLGEMYEENGMTDEAVELYFNAMGNTRLPENARRYFAGKYHTLTSKQ
ncbi:MAG: tetratricopeptide repeat protein [Phycisphaerales bacterium]|nr:tetratricopeptide repeat protein [Phycisphaerales bacterium]